MACFYIFNEFINSCYHVTLQFPALCIVINNCKYRPRNQIQCQHSILVNSQQLHYSKNCNHFAYDTVDSDTYNEELNLSFVEIKNKVLLSNSDKVVTHICSFHLWHLHMHNCETLLSALCIQEGYAMMVAVINFFYPQKVLGRLLKLIILKDPPL